MNILKAVVPAVLALLAVGCVDLVEKEDFDALTSKVDKLSAQVAQKNDMQALLYDALVQRVNGMERKVGDLDIMVTTMKAHGAYTALVSGGFRQFTSKVSAQLGFHTNEANDLIIENGKLAGKVAEPILGKDAKLAALNHLSLVNGLTAADAMAVGDGANDIPMLQAAGMGVALHAKPRVQEAAPHSINHGDLTALLYLQGYKATEFV